MITVKRKPRKCPQCGSSKVAKIQYGMPIYSPELKKDLDEGKIVLGGCCVTGNDPKWQCVDCMVSIYKEWDLETISLSKKG